MFTCILFAERQNRQVPASRAEKVVLNPNVEQWSPRDVCRWLTTLGSAYRIYTAGFVDNGITGEMLLSLNHPSHYATLGVTNSLHVKRINVGVRYLRAHVLQRRRLSSASNSSPSAGAAPVSSASSCFSSDVVMEEEEPMGTGLDSMEMEDGF